MTDDTKFIEWLKGNGFEAVYSDGEGYFKRARLQKDELAVLIGHDVQIDKRNISYFHLFDSGKVRKRVDVISENRVFNMVLMWELPTDESKYLDAIEGKLKPIA